ncbi:hypothetical protein [Flavobacterium cerinum]|uniref:hypothetical protein n=1 Tax=Flavobacterium cerinum TaxID=2502784 RepID=UPI0019D4983F|nr:hypothetical protein [Flavobacterium cerinum]
MKEFIVSHRNFILGILFALLSYCLHLAFRYKNETNYSDSLKFQRSINYWFFIILMAVLALGFFIIALPDSNVLRSLVYNNRFFILFVLSLFTMINALITRKYWLYVNERQYNDEWYKFYKSKKKRQYWGLVIMTGMAIIFLLSLLL